MPMPPPKATTEGPRDRQVLHEMRQIVRALEDRGPVTADELHELVGAAYWEGSRFEKALTLALADGLVVRGSDDRLRSV
ncbi:MAG: hypothetical protein WB797_02805 [Nocardioides sp.]